MKYLCPVLGMKVLLCLITASDVVKGTEADTDDVLSIEGKEFCERHSKSIEVFYKHEKEAEPIHTSIAFPYHPDVSDYVVYHV